MTLQWHGDAAKARIEGAAATGLLRVAVAFVNEHKKRLSVPSPHTSVKRTRDTSAGPRGSRYLLYTAPAVPPEYPRLRTGAGRASVWYEPRSPAEVVAAGLVVRVGYKPTLSHAAQNHLLALEHQGYGGLLKTLDDMRPALAALAKR